MSAQDLDPNYLLPLWRALVAHFGRHPPLVQAHGLLPAERARPANPLSHRQARRPARPYPYLPRDLERRLPPQPSP